MVHNLKILPHFYEAVKKRQKTFEVRLYDRPFAVGDTLILEEYTPNNGYTGKHIKTKITYILNDIRYCKRGYVILGICII